MNDDEAVFFERKSNRAPGMASAAFAQPKDTVLCHSTVHGDLKDGGPDKDEQSSSLPYYFEIFPRSG